MEERRQTRVTQANFATLYVKFKPERRFQQRERRCARPCLRRTGHRIERRSAPFFAAKATKQLGKLPQIHVGSGVEQTLEHMFDRMFEAIAREAEGDQCV